jgi:hypothetical protein
VSPLDGHQTSRWIQRRRHRRLESTEKSAGSATAVRHKPSSLPHSPISYGPGEVAEDTTLNDATPRWGHPGILGASTAPCGGMTHMRMDAA